MYYKTHKTSFTTRAGYEVEHHRLAGLQLHLRDPGAELRVDERVLRVRRKHLCSSEVGLGGSPPFWPAQQSKMSPAIKVGNLSFVLFWYSDPGALSALSCLLEYYLQCVHSNLL